MDTGTLPAHDFLTFWCTSCHHSIQVPTRCPGRTCEICQVSRSMRIRHRIRFLLQNIELPRDTTWKHWTLTIRSQSDLSDMLDSIIKAFRRLRSTDIWTCNVSGGIYCIECTHSDAGWHVHLHVLCIARYMPHAAVVQAWTKITGSCVVWVSRPPSKRLLNYVTKYITKVDIPSTCRWEFNQAFRSRRLWSPFGIAHDVNLRCPPYVTHCPHCGEHAWICIDFCRTVDCDTLAAPT